MKRIILLFSLLAAALSVQAQTTGTWNRVNAKDTLILSGRQLAEVVYSILVTSKNNEIPTAKSVWDLVQSEIGDKISGTGEAPRVAYFTDNDQIGGDPDLTFDDADNILLVENISLDGSNNEITAGSGSFDGVSITDPNAGLFVTDDGTSGTLGGGNVFLSTNDGANTSENDRLGGIVFRGLASSTLFDGAEIKVYARSNWSGTSTPTIVGFSTVATNSTTLVERARFTSNNFGTANRFELVTGTTLDLYNTANTTFGRVEVGDSAMYLVPPNGAELVTYGKLSLSAGATTFTGDKNNMWLGVGSGAVLIQIAANDSSAIITGINPVNVPGTNRLICLYNSGSNDIELIDQSSASLQANRFSIGADFTLVPGDAIWLFYVSTTTGWIIPNNPNVSGGGATDHGALTGLSDDDHSQYLLLAGRATGQVATGGTAGGDDLTLRSTTDATKGDIILNDQGGNVILGGGELSGELRFMEPGGSGSNYTGFKSGAMGANQMYTLPTDAPSDGELLAWNTGGTLSWEAVGGGANYQTWREDGAAATVQPNANFVTSNTIEPTLTNDAGNSETEVSLEIVGNSVNSTHLNQMGAAAGQVLTWDGAAWNPAYVTDDIYPADITVDVNDYEPTGWATSTEVFVSSSAIWTITGFDALVGQVRTVINDGDLPFVIACHHTASAAGNRVFGREDLIVLPGDAVTLTYNNNIGRWYVKSNTFYPQKLGTVWNGIYYYQQPGSTNQSDHPFLGLAVSGTGTGNANETPAAEQANHWDVSTGSTAAGIATIYLPKNANNFARTGDGHIEVQANVFVPTLSTSAQRYTLQVGMIPNANTTTLAVNNSVFVRYKDDVNDGEFELVTRNNAGTETAVDCNVAVAANTPYQITVVLNESRTEARAYINGTLAAINTSTMPNAAVNVGARVGIFKSVGTTARFAKIGSIVGFVVL